MTGWPILILYAVQLQVANLSHARMYVHLFSSCVSVSVLGGRSDGRDVWRYETGDSYSSSFRDREVIESIPEESISCFAIVLSPRILPLRVAHDISHFDEATLTNYSWNATVIGTVLQNLIAHGDNAFKWGRCDNILSVSWKWVSFHL